MLLNCFFYDKITVIITIWELINEIRIAYVLNENDLNKAMNILALGLKEYPGRK